MALLSASTGGLSYPWMSNIALPRFPLNLKHRCHLVSRLAFLHERNLHSVLIHFNTPTTHRRISLLIVTLAQLTSQISFQSFTKHTSCHCRHLKHFFKKIGGARTECQPPNPPNQGGSRRGVPGGPRGGPPGHLSKAFLRHRGALFHFLSPFYCSENL